jgi:hypothetical protein
MANFQLESGFNVPVAVQVLDQNGAVIEGAVLDAGTGTVTVSDSTVLTASLSSDQSTVTVTTVGPAGTDEVVTVDGSVGGVALTGTLAIDVVSETPPPPVQTPTSLGLVPGTPVANAPTVEPPVGQ